MDASTPSSVLVALVRCLRDLVGRNQGSQRPTLILNGDFIELAWGTVTDALKMFRGIAELLLEPGRELIDDFLYLPGNHDHHLWEMARETQFREAVARRGLDELATLPHVTPLTVDGAVPALLLDAVMGHVDHDDHDDHLHHHQAHPVRILYPNLALRDDTGEHLVVIHHGHYAEPLYRFFSRARHWMFPERPAPRSVAELEADNFAWIDFVWSLFGRSGEAGRGVETVFEMLRYPQRVRRFTDHLAERTAPRLRMPYLPFTWIRRIVLRKVFRLLASRLEGERTKTGEVCSTKTMKGTREYLLGVTWRQIVDELGTVPERVTFIFGHTHKPFEKVLPEAPDGHRIEVYNTGGWTVDSATPTPTFGASVILLSRRCEVACVRIYNDAPDGGSLACRVTTPSGDPPAVGSFAAAIQSKIDAGRAVTPDPWGELQGQIIRAVERRRENHRERYGS